MGGIRRIWIKYGGGQPVKVIFDGDDVDELKEAIKQKLPNELGNVDVNQVNLRKHGEEEDLDPELAVDDSFRNDDESPLQVIVNASGMYSSLLESRGSDNSTKIIFT